MRIINIQSTGKNQLIDISSQVQNLIPEGIKDAVCHIFCLHTTAGLTINENADPDVKHDILMALEAIVPTIGREYKHVEGNSAAHIKSSLLGASLTVPVVGGKLSLGQWQGIYFCEFDGPRNRQVHVQFIEELK